MKVRPLRRSPGFGNGGQGNRRQQHTSRSTGMAVWKPWPSAPGIPDLAEQESAAHRVAAGMLYRRLAASGESCTIAEEVGRRTAAVGPAGI